MKKYNISLLAVVFSIALCVATVFGLTGCFKNNPSSESTQSSAQNSEHSDSTTESDSTTDSIAESTSDSTNDETESVNSLSFKTLSVNGDKVYGKVSNDTELFSFIKEIKTAGLMKFVVSLDIYGSQQVAAKTIPLNIGDNIVYIIEMLDGEPQAIYEVTIRRKPLYTVNFNTNGGLSVNNQTIEEDCFANEPYTTKTGYTFIGWNYDFSKPITNNITITASWNTVVYNISYELNGGTNDKSNPTTYTVETSTIDFIAPSRTGYIFKGWYTQKDFSNNNVTNLPQGSYGNITLYADWQIITYNITYVLNGGETIGENPTGYTVESQDIILANPTGVHTFKGWYKDETLKEKITIITSCSLGDITLYADWQHEISTDWIIDKAPTCSNTGLRHKTCPICNVNCNYETLATVSTAHTRGEETKENLIEPTCTEKGSYDIVIRCTECNVILSSTHVKTEMIAHEWNKTKHCKYCNCDYFSQDLQFTLSPSGTSYIISEIGSCVDSDIVIPANYKGNPVTSINYNAFYNCSGLTSIKIGNNVTSIGSSAFSGCSGLTCITIPDSVTSIGCYTFSDCSELTSVIIGNGVTSISDDAFRNCKRLTIVIIGNSVTSIGDWTFYGCNSLTSITIPNGVTSIGNRAFSDCSELTSISIGNGVTSIGSSAFSYCSNLTRITIPSSITSIGSSAFSDCSSLTSVIWNAQNCSDLNIFSIFYRCSQLSSITIGKNVKKIPSCAFYGCNKIKSITIPDSVTFIGDKAFYGCYSLTSITIPDGVTSIGNYAFDGCGKLEIVYYKGSKTQWNKISNRSYNSNLTSATLYYYSKTEPALNSDGSAYDGNYWHYDTDGKTPVIWKKQ